MIYSYLRTCSNSFLLTNEKQSRSQKKTAFANSKSLDYTYHKKLQIKVNGSNYNNYYYYLVKNTLKYLYNKCI